MNRILTTLLGVLAISTVRADEDTLALWLFDDPAYSVSTLTDSGPYRADMVLQAGRDNPPPSVIKGERGLVPGKFGNALRLPIGDGLGVEWMPPSYARFGHADSEVQFLDNPVPEPLNLGYLDFTLEFWFKAEGEQSEPGTVWSLTKERQSQHNTLKLLPGREAFVFSTVGGTYGNTLLDEHVTVPTDAEILNDGDWHHLAFTFTARENQMRHYVDGKLQELPDKWTWQPLILILRDLRVGRDFHGDHELHGWLDELRVSRTVRYTENFTPPGSFSDRHQARGGMKGQSTGPPLLFPPVTLEKSQESLAMAREDFSSDPSWVGVFNRGNESDFGFNAETGSLEGAMSCSQRAYYAAASGSIDPDSEALQARGRAIFRETIDGKNEGGIVEKGDVQRATQTLSEDKVTDVCLGWFNSARYEKNGQLPNGIFGWFADGNRVFASIKTRGIDNFRNVFVGEVPDSTWWDLNYEPEGLGKLTLTIAQTQQELEEAKRGSLTTEPLHQRVLSFTSEPAWEGNENRSGNSSFGWNPESQGVGGNFARSGSTSYYADPAISLTLEDRLTASGKISVEDGAMDASPCFGWFNKETGHGLFLMLADGNRLMAYSDLPPESPAYRTVATYEGGKVYDWEIAYVPEVAPSGSLTVSLKDEAGAEIGQQTIALTARTREAGTQLNAFGWRGLRGGGDRSWVVKGAYVTEAEYTARERSNAARQVSLELLPGEKETIGLLDRFGVVTRHLVPYHGGTRRMEFDDLEYSIKPKAGADEAVLDFGARKHLFLDDQLLTEMNNLDLVANPPSGMDVTDFFSTEIWEPTPRFGPGIPDPATVLEDADGNIKFIYTNGGMWAGKKHNVAIAESEDGLHFTKPRVGRIPWLGSMDNNIVLLDGSQGAVIYDQNPAEPEERRYKYFAMCMNRGFYVFTSPDLLEWKRNEVAMLPFDPDGSISAFWDDQTGEYKGYIRVWAPGLARQIGFVSTKDAMEPWPFFRSERPQFNPYVLPRPSAGEVDLVDTYGQAYRFKGFKYPGAPDAYLAFPWRYIQEGNVRPGSLLMVSRNGEDWKRYEDTYYLSSERQVEGRDIHEALMEHGMIIRDDEVWLYATVRVTEHGGLMIGGEDHEGGFFDRFIRLRQRLDGFVALTAGAETGTAKTLPMVIDGDSLRINAEAKGEVRVAVLSQNGEEIDGFGLDDCLPVTGDHISVAVKWQGGDLASLKGMPIRLHFSLTDAQLFAFEVQ